MLKKSTFKKILCIALCLCIFLAACSKPSAENPAQPDEIPTPDSHNSIFTDTPDSVTKNETVYVNLNSAGAVQAITVSDHISTDKGNVRVEDVSPLTGITDTKGNLTPIIDGENIIWHSADEDIYYSAGADKNSDLPVSIDISYRLDSKAISAEEAKGKNGKIEIEINFRNNMSKSVEAGGKSHKIYLPVLVVGAVTMPENKFSSVKAENARLIGDASKQTAVFVSIPAAGKSLGNAKAVFGSLGNLLDADTVKISANVEDFSLSNMYFAAIPLSSLNLDLEFAFDSGDLQSLLGTFEKLGESFQSLDPDRLISALTANPGGIDELIAVTQDASKLYTQNKSLIELFMHYMTGENSEKIADFLSFISSEETKAALEFIASPEAQEILSQIPELKSSLELLTKLAKDLNSPEIQKAISSLPQTVKKLNEIKGTLEKNSSTVDALADFLTPQNTKSINELLKALKESDLEALSQEYSPLSKDAKTVMELAEKWFDFGESYRIFTDAPKNAETSVAFIYKTEAV